MTTTSHAHFAILLAIAVPALTAGCAHEETPIELEGPRGPAGPGGRALRKSIFNPYLPRAGHRDPSRKMRNMFSPFFGWCGL